LARISRIQREQEEQSKGYSQKAVDFGKKAAYKYAEGYEYVMEKLGGALDKMAGRKNLGNENKNDTDKKP